MKYAICIISILLYLRSFSQQAQLQALDSRLAAMYDKLSEQPQDTDQLAKSDAFEHAFIEAISAEPATLTYPFPLLHKGFHIVSSGDGLFRVYSWDDLTGGTMRFYRTVFQYKNDNTVHTKKDTTTGEGDPGTLYSDLFTLSVEGQTYYLAINNNRYSSNEFSQTIRVFNINKTGLNDAKLIKTKSGLTNSISIAYNFSSVADRPERPVKLIKYDAAKKTIYIPIVYPDGTVTSRFILYQFTGQHFEKVQAQSK